ncbi:repeat-containing protein, partial [Candidatus Magnetomorum sp. HK-1]
ESYVDSSNITSAKDVNLDQDIDALVFSGSAAIAGGGTAGIAAIGSGVWAENRIAVDVARTMLVVDGNLTTFKQGNVYVNNVSLSGGETGGESNKIKIPQDSFSASQYGIEGLTVAAIDQDIYVIGDVNNEYGAVSIINIEGSVKVSGNINAGELDIQAAGNFDLNVEDWYHVRDPRQFIEYPNSLVYNIDGLSKQKTWEKYTDLN